MSVDAGRPGGWVLTSRVSGPATAPRLTPLGWMPWAAPPAVGQGCQGRGQPRLWHHGEGPRSNACTRRCPSAQPVEVTGSAQSPPRPSGVRSRTRPEVAAGQPRDAFGCVRDRCRATPGRVRRVPRSLQGRPRDAFGHAWCERVTRVWTTGLLETLRRTPAPQGRLLTTRRAPSERAPGRSGSTAPSPASVPRCCSPGRNRTYVACPDSKSGGPCQQTPRRHSRAAGLTSKKTL